MATIFLDIIYISIFYSSVAIGDTGRFGAGMAILSLLLKPFSCCLVYHMHRERGGELPLRPGKFHSTLPPPAQVVLLQPRVQAEPRRCSAHRGSKGASAASLQMGCRDSTFLLFPSSPGSGGMLSCHVRCTPFRASRPGNPVCQQPSSLWPSPHCPLWWWGKPFSCPL